MRGVHHLAHFHQLVDNDDNVDRHLAYHLTIYIRIVDSMDMSLALAWYPLSYDAESILSLEMVLSAFSFGNAPPSSLIFQWLSHKPRGRQSY